MNIDVNSKVNMEDMWNLHHKENRTSEESDIYWKTRRNNPELDRALYQHDVAEYYKEIGKIEDIKQELFKDMNDKHKCTNYYDQYGKESLNLLSGRTFNKIR